LSPERRSALKAGIALGLLLLASQAQAETGIASAYDYPQPVACGGRYDRHAMTAAHKFLPCGSRVRVVGINGKSIMVTINDRGPFVRGRIIDLSWAAAQAMGMGMSIMRVSLEVVK
jgi:rare lipoprotein A